MSVLFMLHVRTCWLQLADKGCGQNLFLNRCCMLCDYYFYGKGVDASHRSPTTIWMVYIILTTILVIVLQSNFNHFPERVFRFLSLLHIHLFLLPLHLLLVYPTIFYQFSLILSVCKHASSHLPDLGTLPYFLCHATGRSRPLLWK